jgi:hypothetical protein
VLWTNRDGFAQEQRSQVRLDIGHRRDGGARALDGRTPVNRDTGWDRLETRDRRPLETLQKLPRVGAKAFDEAALPFRIQRVEREAALARAAHARNGHDLPRFKLEIDPLQVVRTRPFEDRLLHRQAGT